MTAGEASAETVNLVRDSVGFVREPGRLERLRTFRYREPGYDPADWGHVIELGLLGLRVPEEKGGAAFGMAEFVALAEELGTGLAPETILQAAAIAPMLPDELLSGALAGTRIVLPALQEVLGDPSQVSARLAGGRLTGTKRFIPYALSATDFLVSAGEGLALVVAAAPGVRLKTDQLQDGGHFGTLTLADAAAQPVDGAIDEAREEIVLALSAYLLGMAQRTFEITREYLLTREQFGRPIGAFQALQHRMVDLYQQLALTRAGLNAAAREFDAGATGDARAIAASRVKARASDTAMMVATEAVQMHGGMGYTDECDVGLYLRKAMVLANAFGSSAWHRRRFAALADLPSAREAA